jgi:branched-chain amino acid transport system substrate-binding protein
VGPLSSSDSTVLVSHLLGRAYPTLIISPSATSPALTNTADRLAETDLYGLFWRTCPSDVLQGGVLANLVATEATGTLDSVSIIYIQDTYGEGLQQEFSGAFEALDAAHTTFLHPFDANTDRAQLASEVAADAADAVVIIAVYATETIDILEPLSQTSAGAARYFFTDGSKDRSALIDDPDLSPAVRAIIAAALGTAPGIANQANPAFDTFDANLRADFGLGGADFAFLANSYDAGFLAALGVVFASADTSVFDGRRVAAGIASTISGPPVTIGGNGWQAAKGSLAGGDAIDIDGISGPLDFDVATGEAEAPIEIWRLNMAGTDFETVQLLQP